MLNRISLVNSGCTTYTEYLHVTVLLRLSTTRSGLSAPYVCVHIGVEMLFLLLRVGAYALAYRLQIRGLISKPLTLLYVK